MFQPRSKKKPPPRPPPPNFNKYKSKSTFNLAQHTQNLIEWSPPSSPKAEHSRQFGGSISSSYSSSASSLASSKKSLENDPSLFHLNFNSQPMNWNNVQKEPSNTLIKPRIIRPQPPKSTSKEALNKSPPMPNVPPPSPPQGNYQVITPYGIALFDFPASQPGDLPLQIDDVVILLRRVNKEWLYGKVGEQEGIFPESFVRIEVPLPNEENVLTALFEFTPQITGDLELKPGQKVKIIREVSDDWLYGESNGNFGQFPRNFVS